jgi:phospholipase C
MRSGMRPTARRAHGAAIARVVAWSFLAMVASVAFAAFGPRAAARTNASPIKHVVILFQENHSFDDVLGKFCVQNARCDGAVTGQLHDGTTIPLSHANDIVWHIRHTPQMMRTAIAGGKMNGFDLLKNCREEDGYGCYTQYNPEDIPNLTALASSFVVSDATFQSSLSGSWTSHIEVVTSTINGFDGNNPVPSKTGHDRGRGWGCDSFMDARWSPPIVDRRGNDSGGKVFVPSCIPDQNGQGPYRTSPVPWVPTIMDRLDGAGEKWKLYGGNGANRKSYGAGYFWQVCPTFYECLNGSQADNWVSMRDLLGDAKRGRLPAVSLVTPTLRVSQHNDVSMANGDNWIGEAVSAIQDGPDWASTAIFITYDECGCFYDHVPPPIPGRGLRVPMVIVSPYAKPGFTDSSPASFNSILAFIEHTFTLEPLSSEDATAYDYSQAFNYAQPPVPPVPMVRTPIPQWELRYMAAHPGDLNDPT